MGGSESRDAGNLLPSIEEQLGHGGPSFFLALEGTCLRKDFPEADRVIEGTSHGITVGRAHQKDLHTEAFRREIREYLSRDHFRIDRDRDGYFSLVALSSNPIWRARNGQRRELERGDQPLSIIHGDAILLFTGATDCTPDGPENLGSLKWTFHDACNSRRSDFMRENDTIPQLNQMHAGLSGHSFGGSLSDKDRGCLPQGIFGWEGGDDAGHGYSAGGASKRSSSARRGTVTFDDADDQDRGRMSSMRPATGYVRDLPPER
ncbi:unnamed protein product [Polarella glacialis]|uniref:FHA domain-containing protein n=1 Tax=Polarella glacialis TaxID=89957 RepID=A0A813DX14_POLGL|nr:unnamed protein product [Polarella glacialis]